MGHSSGVRAVLSDISEKRSICLMCQTTECDREQKRKFQNNYKARSCPEFTYPRGKADIGSWERSHEK